MPLNTKEIRRRIKGVASTRQITKAMEMVAAAKVRRVQARTLAARPYAKGLAEVYAAVTGHLPAGEVRSPLLARREVKKVAIVLVTSDKGLAGAFNSNVIRLAVSRLREWKAQGVEPQLILVGTKGVNFFRNLDTPIASRYTQLPAIPTFAEAAVVCDEVIKLFREQKVDKVEFIHTQFRSMLLYTPQVVDLLPATLPETQASDKEGSYLFEPSAEGMIEELIPKYLETVIFQGLLESSTSFFASQMTAMSSASKNAGEMISSLTLILNKARQASITQEILEVVGGAEALKA